MKKVAIIGSHGYKASYGGWDQLVNNLVNHKSDDLSYLIFSPFDNPYNGTVSNCEFICLPLPATGIRGLLYDWVSVILSYFRGVKTYLLLGLGPVPIVRILKIFSPSIKMIVNIGGVEWERPKFTKFAKLYLKFSLRVARNGADILIVDNEYYKTFLEPGGSKIDNVRIIPYGGDIDYSLILNYEYKSKYPFLSQKYYLSISRSLEDNFLIELCITFSDMPNYTLVLMSNFSSSEYGKRVIEEFGSLKNIILIDSVYSKPEVDLIRRHCYAYIHTHTLCGSAPSLIEIVKCKKPVYSIDVPQNRYTLNGNGYYFKNFDQLKIILGCHEDKVVDAFYSDEFLDSYSWVSVVAKYESLY